MEERLDEALKKLEILEKYLKIFLRKPLKIFQNVENGESSEKKIAERIAGVEFLRKLHENFCKNFSRTFRSIPWKNIWKNSLGVRGGILRTMK